MSSSTTAVSAHRSFHRRRISHSAEPSPATDTSARIIIADDHEIVRTGLKVLFATQAEWKIVGEASSPGDLLSLLSSCPCDVLITDYSMPSRTHADGAALISTIRRLYADLPVVVITMLRNPQLFGHLLKSGVCAIVEKTCEPHEFISALRSALHHRPYLSRAKQDRTVQRSPDRRKLTPNQLELIRMLAAGRSISEISRVTSRSKNSVSRLKTQAMQRLEVDSHFALMLEAKRLGLADYA